jgi:hemoglobin/transferrin/lactoferrin receptor protein
VRLSDRRQRFWAEYSGRFQAQVDRVAPTLLGSPFLIVQDLFGLDGFALHRAAAGFDWRQEGMVVGLSLALENLGDRFYREQFQFAPARGRSFTVGLHVRRE